jgi:hypothetical protein
MAETGSSFTRLAGEIAQDTGYAVRTLRREPALLVGIVLTLALALGVNAAMFGVVSRLLFSPPAGVAQPQSVYRVNSPCARTGVEFVLTSTSYPAFQQLHTTRVFAAVAAVRTVTATVDRGRTSPRFPQLAPRATTSRCSVPRRKSAGSSVPPMMSCHWAAQWLC